MKRLNFLFSLYFVLVVGNEPAFGIGINDGTLPLKLDGSASDLGNQTGQPLSATVSISQARSENSPRGTSISCQNPANNVKLVVTGTVRLGSRDFSLSGACGNESDDQIELIGTGNNGESVHANGNLAKQGNITEFDGRLQLLDPRQSARRFAIRLRSLP